jgi:hypothetical protein
MGDAFPSDRKQRREALLDDVDKIAPVLQACGAKSEEPGTLSHEAVIALRTMGMVELKPCTQMGGSGADSVTEMMVLEQLACLEKVVTDADGPTEAAAGRAVRGRNGFAVGARRRFSRGIGHAQWVPGTTVERALMYERYQRLCDSVSTKRRPDRAAVADARAICVCATDVATETATMGDYVAGNTRGHTISSAVCCAPSASLAFTRR